MYKRICSILLLFIFLLAGCNSSSGGEKRPTEGESVITICAVGDIFLTEDMLSDARQFNGGYDFSSQFSHCYSAISSADIAIGNFEGNFTASSYGAGSYPDALASTLADAGFDILQTANSYSIQGGLSGLIRTKDVIESAGMKALGTYADAKERKEEQVLLLEVDDVRVAFVAFTKGFGGMALPENADYSTNVLYSDYTTNYEKVDTEGILEVLKAAQKLSPDIIIASVHWGSENVKDISRSQEQITELMLENGVDVILGSHSHLIGSVEQRHIKLADGSRNDAVIAYSLGDFSAAEAGEYNMSIILNLEITRNHATGEARITHVGYIPIAGVDLGSDEQDRYAVLNVDNAIDLYESNYYDRVSNSVYQAILKGKEDLENANIIQ